MAATTTVRVAEATRDRLNRLAEERGVTVSEVLDDLTRREEEDVLLGQMNAHYEELRSVPEAWDIHKAEVALWDTTAGDGLADG